MEYIDGSTCLKPSARVIPPFRAVMEIGAMVAGTLDRAHGRHPRSQEPLGVVHQAASPPTSMSSSGSHKLLDFGIAQAKFAARESTTGQMVLGTLNYMAPDYIITGEVTQRSMQVGLTIFQSSTSRLCWSAKLREQAQPAPQGPTPAVESLNADLRISGGDAPLGPGRATNL